MLVEMDEARRCTELIKLASSLVPRPVWKIVNRPGNEAVCGVLTGVPSNPILDTILYSPSDH